VEEGRAPVRTSAIISLVLANAVPLAGVLLLGWNVFSILVIYWVETGIVVGCGVVKLLQERRLDPKGLGLPLAATVGFMGVHYLFLYIGGIFMSEIHSARTLLEPLTDRPSIWSSVALILASRIHSMGIVPRRPGMQLQGGEDLFVRLLVPRIMIQGMMILMAFGLGLLGYQHYFLAIAALVIVKTTMDLVGLRRRRAGGDPPGPVAR
jgi:hypothetical protein